MLRNVQGIHVAKWVYTTEQSSEQAQLWPQYPLQSKQTTTSGYGLSVKLAEFSQRETFLPALFTTLWKKARKLVEEGRKNGWIISLESHSWF